MDSNKRDLVECVKSLYTIGLTTSVSGNHSVRVRDSWMWITPSGVPRYRMRADDLVRIDLKTGKVVAGIKPSMELNMHMDIYSSRPDINAIVHAHSPFTIGISISSEFRHVIEEAKIVVGEPAVIANKPSGSIELAEAVSVEFRRGARAVVVKNHGVIAGGMDIHHARAIVESLEEWAKILTVARIFGGVRDYLD
ncbi:MAG TPA: class II aldolase/adducin family protein [Nitrososphaera sp.]|nr:class II aldolase/adducin family protein [Nitrososphaera sp.]